MPIVTAAVLAYAAGLLAGFGAAFVWAAAAVAAVVAGGRTGRDRLCLAAIAVAGLSTATAGERTTDDCRRQLLQRRAWEVTIDAEADAGAFVLARHACGVRFRMAIASGRAAAGARVAVTGAATAGRDGIVVNDARIVKTRAPSVTARWREAIGRGLDARFGEDAPLVRALLIADMHELSPTIRQRFAAAGMSHMLSVSGLHVGLIAVAVSLLAQLLGLHRTRGDALVMVLVTAYVIVIGAPLPAIRAAAMLAAYSMSRTLQRPTSAWAVLAMGAALPLVDPRAVTDVGYQLSVVGMVALIAAGALAKRWRWLKQRGWRGGLYRGIAASIMATLLTAPLVAATFGRVSLIAPLSNLVAVPVIGVLQPMLFLAAALLPVPVAAQFVADACHPLIVAVDWVASLAAAMPGASLAVVTDGTSIMLATALGAAITIAAVSRFPGRAMIAAAGCAALLAWRPLLPQHGQMTELHVIDVGQGDALALRTARGRWVLFDAGREWRGGDAGQRDVIPYIASRGGPVLAFVLSHPHADHVGGAASTIRALRPPQYFDPGYAGGTTPYRLSLLEAQRTHTRWTRVHPGDSIVVDEATIAFLAPDSAWAESQGDPNLASTVARVRVGQVVMLLTGDAEAAEERWLMANAPGELRADVLKVAHHGSATSSTGPFLDAVRPRLALVSVGAGNMYGHPNRGVLRALAAHGAVTLRTDLDGSVIVRTDGAILEVESAGERWRIP